MTLGTFFEIVRDRYNFIKIAKRVMEAYKGEEVLK